MFLKLRGLCLVSALALWFGAGPLRAESELENEPGRHMEEFLRQLHLSDAQKEQLKGKMAGQKEENEKIKNRLRELGRELHTLRDQEQPDESRMLAIGREMGELKIRAGLQHKKFMDGLKVNLNEEQHKKLESMQKDFADSMREEAKERWRKRQEMKEHEKAEAKSGDREGNQGEKITPEPPENAEHREIKKHNSPDKPEGADSEEWKKRKQRMLEKFNELKEKREAQQKAEPREHSEL